MPDLNTGYLVVKHKIYVFVCLAPLCVFPSENCCKSNIVKSWSFVHTGAHFTFFSLSAAAPERIASSIASLAKAGFMGLLLLGFSRSSTGGGGGGAFMAGCGISGGVGVKTGGVAQVTEGVEGQERGPAPSPSSEDFLNLSSSSAASDFVWRAQRHLEHINMC